MKSVRCPHQQPMNFPDDAKTRTPSAATASRFKCGLLTRLKLGVQSSKLLCTTLAHAANNKEHQSIVGVDRQGSSLSRDVNIARSDDFIQSAKRPRVAGNATIDNSALGSRSADVLETTSDCNDVTTAHRSHYGAGLGRRRSCLLSPFEDISCDHRCVDQYSTRCGNVARRNSAGTGFERHDVTCRSAEVRYWYQTATGMTSQFDQSTDGPNASDRRAPTSCSQLHAATCKDSIRGTLHVLFLIISNVYLRSFSR